MKEEIATVGAGCFWGVEEAYRTMPGVIRTAVGFMGGTVPNPSYKDVCTGDTGHAEVTQITYDPGLISYTDILNTFWKIHDPTQLDQQGPDIGHQYRSVIFYHTTEQGEEARISKAQEEKNGGHAKPVMTAIEPAGKFYKAEEHHQQYFLKNGGGVCHV